MMDRRPSIQSKTTTIPQLQAWWLQCNTLLYSSMPPYEEGNMTDEEVGESFLIEMEYTWMNEYGCIYENDIDGYRLDKWAA